MSLAPDEIEKLATSGYDLASSQYAADQADAVRGTFTRNPDLDPAKRCTWCGGSGYDYTRRRMMCSVCGATGFNQGLDGAA